MMNGAAIGGAIAAIYWFQLTNISKQIATILVNGMEKSKELSIQIT